MRNENFSAYLESATFSTFEASNTIVFYLSLSLRFHKSHRGMVKELPNLDSNPPHILIITQTPNISWHSRAS